MSLFFVLLAPTAAIHEIHLLLLHPEMAAEAFQSECRLLTYREVGAETTMFLTFHQMHFCTPWLQSSGAEQQFVEAGQRDFLERRAELGKNHPDHRNPWMWSTLKHSQVWECQSGEEVVWEDGPILSWNTGGGAAGGRQGAKLKMADVAGARSAYRVFRV